MSQGTAAIVMMGQNVDETIKNNVVNNSGRAASFNTSRTVFYRNAVRNVTATAGDGFQANSNSLHDVLLAENAFSGANAAIYNAEARREQRGGISRRRRACRCSNYPRNGCSAASRSARSALKVLRTAATAASRAICEVRRQLQRSRTVPGQPRTV